jgi:hypothetical protein
MQQRARLGGKGSGPPAGTCLSFSDSALVHVGPAGAVLACSHAVTGSGRSYRPCTAHRAAAESQAGESLSLVLVINDTKLLMSLC